MTINEFIIKEASEKDREGLTWFDIAYKANSEFGTNLTAEACRKRAMRASSFEEEDTEESIDDKILELKKERMKLSDERTQANAIIRRIAREETIKEIAEKYCATLDKIYKLPTFNDKVFRENLYKEGILLLSDWHYGIDVDNIFNKYSPEICKKRVNYLERKVSQILHDEEISTLNIINLGDMIAGRIHLTIRLNSRIDVITQTMEVAELLAQFITNITSQGVNINYYSTSDNHSRLEPNLKDSLELESLSRIIDWFLRARLRDNDHVVFYENQFGDDIVAFKILQYKVAGVHGNKDKLDKIIDRLNTFTHEHFDLICSAHYHHFSCDESNETVLISNASLMGTDDFAFNLRLNSKPSQVLIVSTQDNICDHLYKINLDKEWLNMKTVFYSEELDKFFDTAEECRKEEEEFIEEKRKTRKEKEEYDIKINKIEAAIKKDTDLIKEKENEIRELRRDVRTKMKEVVALISEYNNKYKEAYITDHFNVYNPYVGGLANDFFDIFS